MKSFQQAYTIFVDESGDPSIEIDKAGVSPFFVVTAVIVKSEEIPILEQQLLPIIRKYFPRGELKSSRISKNIDRRERLIKDLSNLNFEYYSLVINKRLIFANSGLAYKTSFYKFISKRLYLKTYHAFSNIKIVADAHGHKEFRESFENYINNLSQPSLLHALNFSAEDSKQHPLIQVADIISGTINRLYEKKDKKNLLPILDKQVSIIEDWPPPEQKPLNFESLETNDKIDYIIRDQSILKARTFVEKYDSSTDILIRDQVNALRYLLYQYNFVDPTEYTPASKIISYLNFDREEELSDRQFKLNVIAKLRDYDVLIASSNKGYKIPYGQSDIREYVTLAQGLLIPYLRRLNSARKTLLLASHGEYDIVGLDSFQDLKKLCESCTSIDS